jgi:predicted heme/steroid binding protein
MLGALILLLPLLALVALGGAVALYLSEDGQVHDTSRHTSWEDRS